MAKKCKGTSISVWVDFSETVRKKRMRLWDCAKVKSKEPRQKLGGVCFNDNLTACNKRLLWLTRTKAAELVISTFGSLTARCSLENKWATIIKCEIDLRKIK